jgi:CDP-diacylglycerol--glycerol-3-phosphate 3-phosphatidyltransferase
LVGSVLDIAADRTLEYVVWVVFAHLGLIPVVVPIIVLIRGTAVDAVRAVGMSTGKSPFDQIHSPINRFLVKSRFMRAFYGTVKGVAGTLLTLAYPLMSSNHSWAEPIYSAGMIFTWISVITCLVRGFPVLREGFKFFAGENHHNQ